MKIDLLGKPEIIMSAPGQSRGYFGWPTAAITKDGRIAAACSGFRIDHVCPFGKAVVSYSSDKGNTFTVPEAVIDTVLDDRDAGLCPFGKSGLIVTSFNNTAEFQRKEGPQTKECFDYLDTVTPEAQAKALGSEFRISLDNGGSWSDIYHSPVTSPHGPVELRDGRILWVGRLFTAYEPIPESINAIQIWEIRPDGTSAFVGSIENIVEDGDRPAMHEPHMIELDSGELICHIRAEGGKNRVFTVYQSESSDGGVTWTKPHRILEPHGGSPAHLLQLSDGTVISAYGYRREPCGIRVMFSRDNCRSWQTDEILFEHEYGGDLGYPATVELDDGTLFTVFYAHPDDKQPAVIFSQKWQLTE